VNFMFAKYDVPDNKYNFNAMRRKLYWNPAIRTDSTGGANVSFLYRDVNFLL